MSVPGLKFDAPANNEREIAMFIRSERHLAGTTFAPAPASNSEAKELVAAANTKKAAKYRIMLRILRIILVDSAVRIYVLEVSKSDGEKKPYKAESCKHI